ncbi:hypothetical protein [Lysobacter gummosus]
METTSKRCTTARRSAARPRSRSCSDHGFRTRERMSKYCEYDGSHDFALR